MDIADNNLRPLLNTSDDNLVRPTYDDLKIPSRKGSVRGAAEPPGTPRGTMPTVGNSHGPVRQAIVDAELSAKGNSDVREVT